MLHAWQLLLVIFFLSSPHFVSFHLLWGLLGCWRCIPQEFAQALCLHTAAAPIRVGCTRLKVAWQHLRPLPVLFKGAPSLVAATCHSAATAPLAVRCARCHSQWGLPRSFSLNPLAFAAFLSVHNQFWVIGAPVPQKL